MKQVPSQLFQTNFIQRKQTYYNRVHYKRKGHKRRHSLTKRKEKRENKEPEDNNNTNVKSVEAFQSKHYKAAKANQTIWHRFKAKPMAKALAKLTTE